MKLRTILFWIHLTAGLVAGIVILMMAVTGTLLTFQQSVLKIVERSQRLVEAAPDAQRLELDALVARVRAVSAGAQPASVTLDSDPDRAASVALGAQGMLFVNPYTGDVLGAGSASTRAFYRSVTNWHRWLAVETEHRAAARAVTGACNAAFFVLAVSGLYLWWPRQWTLTRVAAIMTFRRGLRGKARDFNWHNVIGFWCAPVLVVLTASGMVISYTWAGNLVYTLTGSPRPATGGRGGGPRGAEGRTPRGSRESADVKGADDPAGSTHSTPRLTLEALLRRAERKLPTWRTIVVRLPPRPGGPVAFSMSDRNYWNSFARSTLTLDGTTGEEIRWEPYAQTSLGQKTRGWLRFAHTGELGGIPGEAVAGLASAGGTFLVWTGVALALRRFSAWRARRRYASQAETPAARVA